ncbi:MAG: hypothetical protein DMF68_20345 [Acidobacteria bacterium]|nr:MAG: hypothetical protein DMF68_20345 [Acidobacteriota bacterium]
MSLKLWSACAKWSKQIDLDLQQVERFLKEKVTGFVSSDYQTAVTSINLGQPLVQSEPSSKIAVEVKRIATTITGASVAGADEQPQRRKIWSGLFKRSQPIADFGMRTAD